MAAEYDDCVARTGSLTVDTDEFKEAKAKEDRKKQLLDKITGLLKESRDYKKVIEGYVSDGKKRGEAIKDEEMAKEAQEKAKKYESELKKLQADLDTAKTKANSKNARDKAAGQKAKEDLEKKIAKAEELKTIADGELEDRNKKFTEASSAGVEKEDKRLKEIEDGLAAKKTAKDDAKKAFDDAKKAFDESAGTEEEKAALKKAMEEKEGEKMQKDEDYSKDEEEMAPLKKQKDRRDKEKTDKEAIEAIKGDFDQQKKANADKEQARIDKKKAYEDAQKDDSGKTDEEKKASKKEFEEAEKEAKKAKMAWEKEEQKTAKLEAEKERREKKEQQDDGIVDLSQERGYFENKLQMLQNKIDLSGMALEDAVWDDNGEGLVFWEGALNYLYNKYDDDMHAFNSADGALREAKFEQFTQQQAQDEEDAKRLD